MQAELQKKNRRLQAVAKENIDDLSLLPVVDVQTAVQKRITDKRWFLTRVETPT